VSANLLVILADTFKLKSKYPKENDLFLGKMKPGKPLVEVWSGLDVQISRRI